MENKQDYSSPFKEIGQAARAATSGFKRKVRPLRLVLPSTKEVNKAKLRGFKRAKFNPKTGEF